MSKTKTLRSLCDLSPEDTLAEQDEPGVGVGPEHARGNLKPKQRPLFRIKPENAADQWRALGDPQAASDRASGGVIDRLHVEAVVDNLDAVWHQTQPFDIALSARPAIVQQDHIRQRA